MTTVATVVDRIERKLRGQRRNTYLRLDGALDNSQTTITLDTMPGGVDEGSVIQVDYELMLVLTRTNDTTLEVVRAFDGSVAVTHTDDTLVEVDPRFPRWHLLDAMKAEILSWPSFCGKLVSTDLTFASTNLNADLTGATSVRQVLRVQKDPQDAYSPYQDVPFKVTRNENTSNFASGFAIHLNRKAFGESTTVRVTYLQDFDVSTFVAATDLEDDVGVSEDLIDALEMGSIAREFEALEAARSDLSAQGQPRLSEEVPVGYHAQSSSYFFERRDARMMEYQRKLADQYPMKFEWGG